MRAAVVSVGAQAFFPLFYEMCDVICCGQTQSKSIDNAMQNDIYVPTVAGYVPNYVAPKCMM